MAKLVSTNDAQTKDLNLLRERLAAAYGLEDTVKRQELVIEKLEQFIHKIIKDKKSKKLLIISCLYLKYLIELYKSKAIPATNSASKLEFDRVNEEILDIKVNFK